MWRKPEMPCAKSNSRPVFDTIDTPSTIFAGTSKICQKKYMLNQAWHFSISFFLSYIYGCYYRASHTSYLQTQMLYNRIAVEKWLSEKKAGLANSTDCSQSFIHNSHWISFDLGHILSKKDLRIFRLHSKDTKNPVIKLSRPVNLHFALPPNIEAVAEGSTAVLEENPLDACRDHGICVTQQILLYGTYM